MLARELSTTLNMAPRSKLPPDLNCFALVNETESDAESNHVHPRTCNDPFLWHTNYVHYLYIKEDIANKWTKVSASQIICMRTASPWLLVIVCIYYSLLAAFFSLSQKSELKLVNYRRARHSGIRYLLKHAASRTSLPWMKDEDKNVREEEHTA